MPGQGIRNPLYLLISSATNLKLLQQYEILRKIKSNLFTEKQYKQCQKTNWEKVYVTHITKG